MYYAQIDTDGNASILDVDSAYPGGGFAVVQPLLEAHGYGFVPLDNPELPGSHYNWDTGEFYTPELARAEPTIADQVAALSHKLDEQAATLMQIGMLAAKPPEVPETPPELPTTPPEVPDADTLKDLMGGMTVPPDLP